jgi:hypothetical protein
MRIVKASLGPLARWRNSTCLILDRRGKRCLAVEVATVGVCPQRPGACASAAGLLTPSIPPQGLAMPSLTKLSLEATRRAAGVEGERASERADGVGNMRDAAAASTVIAPCTQSYDGTAQNPVGL